MDLSMVPPGIPACEESEARIESVNDLVNQGDAPGKRVSGSEPCNGVEEQQRKGRTAHAGATRLGIDRDARSPTTRVADARFARRPPHLGLPFHDEVIARRKIGGARRLGLPIFRVLCRRLLGQPKAQNPCDCATDHRTCRQIREDDGEPLVHPANVELSGQCPVTAATPRSAGRG